MISFTCLMVVNQMLWLVLPSNNKLNVEPIGESPKNWVLIDCTQKLIDNFSLMQALNILSLMDYNLEALANKIWEMKHLFISCIKSTLTMLRSFTANFWSPMKVKLFSTIGTPTRVIIILFISITLYSKCFQNGNSCVTWTH